MNWEGSTEGVVLIIAMIIVMTLTGDQPKGGLPDETKIHPTLPHRGFIILYAPIVFNRLLL